MRGALALSMIAAACSTPPVEGRFKDQPIVWRVADDRDIPEPMKRDRSDIVDSITRSIDPPEELPAQNTNALDEVPDSTWFSNRIGLRDLTADEIESGPAGHGPPQPPFEIAEGKIEGKSPGFLIDDARGLRYLIKFDQATNPEQQTGAEVVASRIMWAAGYNVPSNHLVHFTSDNLRLAPGIVYRDPNTKRMTKLTDARVAKLLSVAAKRADGAHRGVASELLEGKRKGGWLDKGVRSDDPNDRVPHQYRRELRGLRVIAAWLGQTDMTRSNSLDMYVEVDGRKFLRHYLVDFGGAFGGQQSELGRKEVGWEHSWDLQSQGRATVSFGMWTRDWERQEKTRWKSIGYFSSKHFDPTRWREFESYAPFSEMDRADAYWAAKIVMRFNRPLLAGLVAAGGYTEPGAAKYLVSTLIERRDRTGATYFEAVTPLDEFRFTRAGLCAMDLSVKYGLASGGIVEILDARKKVGARVPVGTDGVACIPIADDSAYRILRLRIRRGRHKRPILQLHYKGGRNPRLLGVIRVAR